MAINETITTEQLFAAFPDAPISRITAFFDIVCIESIDRSPPIDLLVD